MRKIFSCIALGLVLFCLAAATTPLFAQEVAAESPVIAPSSIWYEVWTIVQPIVVLAVTTISPFVVTWITYQVSRLLRIEDEKKKLEVEAQLRNALHDAAINALKFAATKFNTVSLSGPMSRQIMDAAKAYVMEKNPETLAKLGVDQKNLEQIIMSKMPDLISTIQTPLK